MHLEALFEPVTTMGDWLWIWWLWWLLFMGYCTVLCIAPKGLGSSAEIASAVSARTLGGAAAATAAAIGARVAASWAMRTREAGDTPAHVSSTAPVLPLRARPKERRYLSSRSCASCLRRTTAAMAARWKAGQTRCFSTRMVCRASWTSGTVTTSGRARTARRRRRRSACRATWAPPQRPRHHR